MWSRCKSYMSLLLHWQVVCTRLFQRLLFGGAASPHLSDDSDAFGGQGSMCSGVARNFSQGVRNSNWLQFSTDAFTVSDESVTLTGERVITAALPLWKLDRSRGDASWRTYDDGGTLLVAARTPSTYSTKNSAIRIVRCRSYCWCWIAVIVVYLSQINIFFFLCRILLQKFYIIIFMIGCVRTLRPLFVYATSSTFSVVVGLLHLSCLEAFHIHVGLYS